MALDKKDYPEIVRLTQSDYDRIKNTAKMVLMEAARRENRGDTTFEVLMYPRTEELKEHEVEYEMRKYLPYLIIYREPELFTSDDPSFEDTKAYIDGLFDEYVDIMDDEDCEEVRNLSPEEWKDMTFRERCAVFGPMLQYYGWNEFDSFCRDLGWQPYMQYAKYTKKRYDNGEVSEKVVDDLQDIWEAEFA